MFRLVFMAAVMLIMGFQAKAAVKWNNSSDKEFICETGNADTYFSGKNKVAHKIINGVIVFPDFYELPQRLKPCANDKTLNFYYSRWLGERKGKDIWSLLQLSLQIYYRHFKKANF